MKDINTAVIEEATKESDKICNYKNINIRALFKNVLMVAPYVEKKSYTAKIPLSLMEMEIAYQVQF